MTPNTANSGSDGGAVVKRINATYLGWPLDVIEFRTSEDLAKAAKWKAGEAPGRGEPPVALAGSNILVKWGPWAVGAKPATPDDRQAAALHALVERHGSIALAAAHANGRARGDRVRSRSQLSGPVRRTEGDTRALRPYASCDHRSSGSTRMSLEGRPRPRPVSARAGDEVSDLDKRIIEHLQADGRRPFTQIAADLGVSEAAVRARTNRLIERGILQVVGVTDPLKLGFHQMAMIGIRCESDQLVTVADQIAEMPEVDYVVITAGTYDLLDRDRVRGQRGPPALPDREAARARRRARDRDVRVPADGQADLPVGHALTSFVWRARTGTWTPLGANERIRG